MGGSGQLHQGQPRGKYDENGLSNVEAKLPQRRLGGVVGTKACPE